MVAFLERTGMNTLHKQKRHLWISLIICICFSGCGVTRQYTPEEEKVAYQRVYDSLQSTRLIEDFPFYNPFTLDTPNAQERAGILLQPFQGKTLNVLGKHQFMQQLASVDAFLYGAFEKPSTWDRRGSSSYSLTRSKGSPESFDLHYTIDATTVPTEGSKFGFTKIISKADLKSKVKLGQAMELDETEFRLKETFEGVSSFLTKGWAFSEENNLLLRDIDTDEVVGIREITSLTMVFPILPRHRVKPGDKWEKQVYTWFKADGVIVPRYAIELYTFELAGFANYEGKRCAIVEYIMEEYEMGAGGTAGVNSVDDVKKRAKTLTKVSAQEISTLISQVNRTGLAAVLSQGSEKHYGIFAFDYQYGVMLELHDGTQYHQAQGTKTEAGVSASRTLHRRQFVYKADVIESGTQ
jgi:hypothetical protein